MYNKNNNLNMHEKLVYGYYTTIEKICIALAPIIFVVAMFIVAMCIPNLLTNILFFMVFVMYIGHLCNVISPYMTEAEKHAWYLANNPDKW